MTDDQFLAAELALRILDLTTPTDDDWFPRAVSAVDALMAASRVAEAYELAHNALATGRAPPDVAAELRLTLASLAFMQGRPADALDETEAVLAEDGLADEQYAAAESTRMIALMAGGDFSRALPTAEAILGGASRSHSDASLSGALTTLGSNAWLEGGVAEAIRLLRAAVARADRQPRGTHHMHPRQSLAVVLAALGEFTEADALLLHDRDEIDRAGDRAWSAAATIRQSCLHRLSGRLVDAVAEANAGLALAEHLGTPLFVPLARSTLALIALMTGDSETATDHVARFRESVGASPPPFESDVCDWVEAQMVEASQDRGHAVALMNRVYTDPRAHIRLLLEEPTAAAWLVRAALAIGDRRWAESIVATVERLAVDSPGVIAVLAIATHTRGLLHRDAAALERAATESRHPWARGTAFEDAGVVWDESGSPHTARVQFERALECYEQMGALRDAARVRAELQEVGAVRPRLAPGERPAEGWGGLTETERRVAFAVAAGFTNSQIGVRMFMSRHTVGVHLRHIFRKLAIHSRVELTRLTVLEHRGESNNAASDLEAPPAVPPDQST